VTAAAVVLVRRGVFRRRADGLVALVDVATGYLQRPGECQQVAHPAGGDVCTSIGISDELADRFAAAGLVTVDPEADLLHRLLLTAHPADRSGYAVDLINALLPTTTPSPTVALLPVSASLPGAARWTGAARAEAERTEARRADTGQAKARHVKAEIDRVTAQRAEAGRSAERAGARRVDEVRELLHTEPGRDLAALAAAVGWSPWHLSRVFHRETGVRLTVYRNRLRVRAALDDLAVAMDVGLAGLAVRHGFADQAHMTRAIRAETGGTPATLRRRLTRRPRHGADD
jgi:AraC-like DNA-binding protein